MPKLTIHKTKPSDIDAIVSMEQHEENVPFIFPNSIEEHQDLLLDDNVDHLLLRSEDKEMIGFVVLAGLKDKNRSIEFRRIVINTKGKGYGRQALKEIKDYSFNQLKCHRLWLDVLIINERARDLYLSEGFRQEGILREAIWKGGNFIDLVVMSMLAGEHTRDRSE